MKEGGKMTKGGSREIRESMLFFHDPLQVLCRLVLDQGQVPDDGLVATPDVA